MSLPNDKAVMAPGATTTNHENQHPSTAPAAPLSSVPLTLEWQADPLHYQLLGKIGQGAFATVWKANHTYKSATTSTTNTTTTRISDQSGSNSNNDELNAIVRGNGDEDTAVEEKIVTMECAVKVLNLDAADTTNLADIRGEVQAMRLLLHPNVLPCHTAFVYDRCLWLVTPLMRKGSSLRSLSAARRVYQQQQSSSSSPNTTTHTLPTTTMEQHILYILHETLLGLQYIHENGQIHRDIKAGNILVDDTGHVKIADFGVAGFLIRGGTQQEKAKTFVGTPCWMAPEVMEQVHGYDYKADIWSLGITALELAKGYAPYAKYPPMKVLILTIQEPPPSLASYDVETGDEDDDDGVANSNNTNLRNMDSYSADFEDLVALCLQKNPLQRPSCPELLGSKYFAKYADAEIRQSCRYAMQNEICALVKDVGGTSHNNNTAPMTESAMATSSRMAVQRDDNSNKNNTPLDEATGSNATAKLPGNAPVSIVWSQAEDRPAGTTWIFADGSQVVSSSAQRHNSNSNNYGNIDEEDDNNDHVLEELDEFERQTGGENYDRRNSTMMASESMNNDSTNVAPSTTEVAPAVVANAVNDNNGRNTTGVDLVAMTSRTTSLTPSRDDLDEFMDEFEQTTAGEDFRR